MSWHTTIIQTTLNSSNYRRLHGNYVSGDELVVANEQIVLEDQIKNETGDQYEIIINDEAGENFYNQTCYLLEARCVSVI